MLGVRKRDIGDQAENLVTHQKIVFVRAHGMRLNFNGEGGRHCEYTLQPPTWIDWR
jgi:hypothetical protein